LKKVSLPELRTTSFANSQFLSSAVICCPSRSMLFNRNLLSKWTMPKEIEPKILKKGSLDKLNSAATKKVGFCKRNRTEGRP
jgi:hypothetical protein